ncbi:hypothetical protein Slala03_75790 [Streptomyces lavendulae subsp. lavendulae]|uniref:hypothetical protein n=1 Tax=Streptomyces lavendulae TaxID=1914 RepID=UPI0024A42A11|nr:hypothetical protein [Streptomyces lavendulae]GLV87890.1 hypothetical protein Slala03_75790 [Streptomyces lavendulae subsp. lavendulae]
MRDRIEPLMPADPARGRRWADHRRTLEANAWKLAVRVRPGTVVGLGLTTSAAGCVVMGAVGNGTAFLVTGVTVTAAGVGTVALLATDIVLAAAPPERAGAASAVAETSTELGAALGIASLGTLSTVFLRTGLPSGTPAADTLGDALREARDHGTTAVSAVREAFAQSLQLTLLTAAAVLVATAAASFLALRNIRIGEEHNTEADRLT